MKKRILAVMMSMVMCAMCLTACGSSKEGSKVVIGSKSFTENILAAEIYALALEDAGVEVERKFELATSGMHESIKNSEIDMYPEYTGTGLVAWLGKEPVYDPDECYDIVKKEYASQLNITWLEPTGVNDTETVVLRKSQAEELGITKVSQLWEITDQLVIGCNPEFFEQAGIYDRLKEVYGEANFKDEVQMEHSLCLVSLRDGEIDVTDAYSTEGLLASGDFVVLEDDKGCWPPYYLAPIIRTEVLDENPTVEEICNKVSATLTTEGMTSLISKVDLDGEDVYDVAAEYYEGIKDQIK